MKQYDSIIIGAGITGSALAYELTKQGLKVLVLEKEAIPNNATSYSYGGLAYWSGTTPLTRQLCQEGYELHRSLSEELEADTEFREVDLLLFIEAGENPQEYWQNYSHFAIQPQLLTPTASCEKEPLLNPEAIAGALIFPHGQINPQATNLAYQQAYLRQGGELKITKAIGLQGSKTKITGVITPEGNYSADHTIICTGGLTRKFLEQVGIHLPVYFTHEQIIKTPPADYHLSTIVMPARLERLNLEAQARQQDKENLWNQPSQVIIPPILDPGAVQFRDRTLLLGQMSQFLSDPEAPIDPLTCEQQIRKGIAPILPLLADLPGTLHNCLVAFADPVAPLVGSLPWLEGIYLFSGFTSTLVLAPPLARRFAQALVAGVPLELFQFSRTQDTNN